MDDPHKETISQVVTAFLSVFGIALDPIAFGVAICVSLGSAILVSRERPKAVRRPFWSAVLAALVVSILGAMLSQHYFPDFPVVIVMIVGGLISSFVLNIIVVVMGRMEDRAANLVDRWLDKLAPGDGEGN